MKAKRFGAMAGGLFLAMTLAAADKPPVTATVPDLDTSARAVWPAETISGRIIAVDPAQKVMVVKTSAGIPYDMIVTPATRIQSGDRILKVPDLAGSTSKPVVVKFTPERRGNMATLVSVGE